MDEYLSTYFIEMNEANSLSSDSDLTIRQKPGISSGTFSAFEVNMARARAGNPFIETELEQSIAHRFERIAAQYPERIAVKVNSGEALTYNSLNRRANRLARAMLACRGEKEEPIALLVSHDDRVIVAMLAAFKAGKICVPIDPSYTVAGLRGVLEDTEAKLVVTDDSYEATVKESAVAGISLLNVGDVAASDSLGNLGLSISPGAPALILYTSGSTGQPKGVVHTHRTILNEIRRQTAAFQISSNDRLSFIAPYNVIGGVREILLPLLNGATLCSLDIRTEGFGGLSDWISEERITVSRFVPSVLRTLVASMEKGAMLSSLRLIFVGGERVRQSDLELFRERFADDCLFVHVLGCTETGIFRHHFISKQTMIEGDDIPVGREVDDVQTLLLDDAGHEVSPGQIGEIAVKSRFLPLGYWRRPELTQSRFLPDPCGGDERTYLTGDLGRLLPDASLVHLGRKDLMVKIRGYRVELGGIEKHILDHVAVKEVIVVALDARSGEKRLNAYVVLKPKASASASDLARFLRARIPDYALPSAFVFLEALPLMPNGKVDRQRLAVPGNRRPELNRPYVSPQNAVQEKLVRIWEDVLDLRPISLDDDFFELGGHSLLAVRLFARIEKELGKQLRPATLNQAPTVEQLARFLSEDRGQEPWSSLMPLQTSGSRPPFFFVHGEFSNALLPAYLGPDQPFYGVEHQGQNGKRALHTRVETIAAHYLKEIRSVQPHGPYFLGGYSFGGTLAFEIAQQITRRDEEVAFLFLLDPGFPEIWSLYPKKDARQDLKDSNSLRAKVSRHLQSFSALGFRDKLTYVLVRVKWKIERTPARLETAWFHTVCNVHIAFGLPIPRSLRSRYILEIYDNARNAYFPEPWRGRVVYVKTEERPPHHYQHWARLIGGGMTLYQVPGEHTTIRQEPYVRPWAGILKTCLTEAQDAAAQRRNGIHPGRTIGRTTI